MTRTPSWIVAALTFSRSAVGNMRMVRLAYICMNKTLSLVLICRSTRRSRRGRCRGASSSLVAAGCILCRGHSVLQLTGLRSERSQRWILLPCKNSDMIPAAPLLIDWRPGTKVTTCAGMQHYGAKSTAIASGQCACPGHCTPPRPVALSPAPPRRS
jgi:hypothetical protein